MRERRSLRLSGLILYVLILIGGQGHAKEITVDFRAKIGFVDLPLQSVFQKSNDITGSYTYDSAAGDLASTDSLGMYKIQNFRFTHNGISASSDGAQSGSGILVINSEHMDIYDIQVTGDFVGSSIDGYEPWSMKMLFVFPPSTLSSDRLSFSAPSLIHARSAELELIFKKERSFSSVHATVTAVSLRK